MSPKPKARNATPIRDPLRCDLCTTTLMLYPPDYRECGVCRHLVCRQCWGEAWNQPAGGDACRHQERNEPPPVSSVLRKVRGPGFDWLRLLGGLLLFLGATLVVWFLVDLLSY